MDMSRDYDDEDYEDKDYDDEDEALDADDDEAFNRPSVRSPFIGGSGLPGRLPPGSLGGAGSASRGLSVGDDDEDDGSSSTLQRVGSAGGSSKDDIRRRFDQRLSSDSPLSPAGSRYGINPSPSGTTFSPRLSGGTTSLAGSAGSSAPSPGSGTTFGSRSGSGMFSPAGSAGLGAPGSSSRTNFGPRSGGGTANPTPGSSPGPTSSFGAPLSGTGSSSDPALPSPGSGLAHKPLGPGSTTPSSPPASAQAAPEQDNEKGDAKREEGEKKSGLLASLGATIGRFGKKGDRADKDKKDALAKAEPKRDDAKREEGEKKGGALASLGAIIGRLGKKGDRADKDKKDAQKPAAPAAGGPGPGSGASPALGSRAVAPAATKDKEEKAKKAAPQPQGGNFFTRLFKRGQAEGKPAARAKPVSKVPVVKDISKEEEGLTLDNWLDILGVGLLLGSLVVFFSAISAERAAIAFVHDFISSALGWGALAVPIAMFAVGLWLVVRHFGDKAPTIDPLRLIGLGIAFVCALTLLQYIHAFGYVGMDNLDLLRLRLDFAWRVERAGGGALGAAVYFFLVSNFTEIGGFFVVLFASVVAVMLMTRLSASDILLYGYGVMRAVRIGLQARAAAQRAKRQLLEQERREKLRAMQAAAAAVSAVPASPPVAPPLAESVAPASALSPERPAAEVALEDRIRVNRGGVTINPSVNEVQEAPLPAPPTTLLAEQAAPTPVPVPVATPTLAALPTSEKRGFSLLGRKDDAEPKPAVDQDAKAPSQDQPALASEKRGFGLFGRNRAEDKKPEPAPKPIESAGQSQAEDKPALASEKRGFGLFGRKDRAEDKKPEPASESVEPESKPQPQAQGEAANLQAGKIAAFAVGAAAGEWFTRRDKSADAAPISPPMPALPQSAPTQDSMPPARPLTPAERAARARQAHAAQQSAASALSSASAPAPASASQPEARPATSTSSFQRPASPFSPSAARPSLGAAPLSRSSSLDDEEDEDVRSAPSPVFQRPASPSAAPAQSSQSALPSNRWADLDDEDEDDEEDAPSARLGDLLAPPSAPRPVGVGDQAIVASREDEQPKRFADLLAPPPSVFSVARPALDDKSDEDEDDGETPVRPFGTVSRPPLTAPAKTSVSPTRWAALDEDDEDDSEDFDEETADEDADDLFPSLASRAKLTPSSPPLRPFGPSPTPPTPNQPRPTAEPLAARMDRLNALRQGQTAPTSDADKLRAVDPATPTQPAAVQLPNVPPQPVTRPAEAPLSGTIAPSGPSAFGKPQDLPTHPGERIPHAEPPRAEPSAEVRTAVLPGFSEPETRPSQLPSVQPSGQQGPQQQTLAVPFSSPIVNQTQAQRAVWKIPDYRALLSSGSEQEVDQALLLRQAKIIEDTLESFGAPGRVIEINTGPVITQFGVEPDYIEGRGGKKQRVKVGAIAALDKDLQLSLGARSIRVEAPVPGKGYVGIEIPNPEPTTVRLRDVMDAPNFQRHKSPLGIALGQSVSGAPVSADLAAMPHLLIAGTTGSGKSVCVNSIITSIISRHSPDTVKFIMVDPKRVELTGYNGIPHLIAPVVVELERIVGVLKWVTREMDERYRRFSQAGARNIEDYNKHRDPASEPLPYIVVIIDELADLMMLAPEETERTIARIAALARATGIHLVIATQRPSVDVVTGLIKANFSTRIAFAVAGSVDSRVILDQPGAERLLGRGDMLYLSGDSPAPVRLQGVYVSDMEINNIVRYWKAQAVGQPQAAPIHIPAANLSEGAVSSVRASERTADRLTLGPRQQTLWDGAEASIPKLPTSSAEAVPLPDGALNGEPMSEDELYEQAVEMVRRLDKASVTLLQRRFRIGYTRAARLIDLMEARGVIGPAKENSSKPRDVLPPR
ncbi:MAG: DNA translocase FtsK [Anaerolineae bacterium]|nr:DNA translocase FtsK [Anaerolineae bacterium]